MNILEIKRFEHDSKEANRGIQFLNGEFFGFSLECPNLGNAPYLSRINPGEYIARRVFSPKRGKFWLLDNANDRTEIILNHSGSTLFKQGTRQRNFKGCIGLGAEIGNISGERAIFETKWMCEQFIKETELFNVMKVIIT